MKRRAIAIVAAVTLAAAIAVVVLLPTGGDLGAPCDLRGDCAEGLYCTYHRCTVRGPCTAGPTSYEYDAQGRVVRQTSAAPGGKTRTVRTTRYEDDGHRVIADMDTWVDGEHASHIHWTRTFDADWRLVGMDQSARFGDAGEAKELTYELEWTDACRGEPTRYVMHEGGASGPVVGANVNRCDERGRLVQSDVLKTGDDGKQTLEQSETWTWGTSDLSIARDDDGDGKTDRREVLTFHPRGHVSRIETYGADGALEGTVSYDYSCWPGLED